MNAELGAGSTAGAALPGMEEMMRAFGTQGHGAHDAMPAADLIAAILEDRPPVIDVYEGARTCAGLRCALESTRTGQPVAIPQFWASHWGLAVVPNLLPGAGPGVSPARSVSVALHTAGRGE